MALRIGVDIGGTFTDLIAHDDETGAVLVAKGRTVAEAPDTGVTAVVREVVSPDRMKTCSAFLHGTTIGLNALLQRRGAVVGMLTTRGFRDILETRRGDRDAMYDLTWKAPDPLVPRRLRLPVTERTLADGSIATPLDLDEVRAAAATLREAGVQSVAIAFINAYANGEHERAAAEALRGAGFDGTISLSHEISGEFREYERTSTTVIDAFVRPAVSSYLRRLGTSLEEDGFRGRCLITRSGGGMTSFADADRRPFQTIMSGPVAGAVGAGKLCDELGISRAITADVGGTSFDTCLILDGRPHVKYEGVVDGMPIQSTWVDVRSIGSGGGSIAYVDEGGLLRVGPQSAGANPGPACYRRGGEQPTVTDAAASLGMLGDGRLAGGLTLDVDAARTALATVGEQVGLDVAEVAQGVMLIATAAMADAIRSVTIEQGEDPRDAAIVAFGGAGPLFAGLLARDLEVATIIVPSHAGNFSAAALLEQDVVRDVTRTSVRPLDGGLAAVDDLLRDLFERLIAESRSDATASDELTLEAALDLRYAGQEYSLSIPVAYRDGRVTSSVGEISESFARDYERRFGHLLDSEIEIMAVRATTRDIHGALERAAPDRANDGPPPELGAVTAYSFAAEEALEFVTVPRTALGAGKRLGGPAIILEETTTTYVDVGFEATVHPSGALILTDTRKEQE